MIEDPSTVAEVRVTFFSPRAGVRKRVVTVELPVGPNLGTRAIDYAVQDLAGTRDLDEVVWSYDDLANTGVKAEVL